MYRFNRFAPLTFQQKIISEITNNSEYRNFCTTRSKAGDDLFQEMCMIFLELPEDKCKKIIEGGYLKWHFIRVALNQLRSKTSAFYYKYLKNQAEELHPSIDIAEEEFDEIGFEIQQRQIEDKLKRLTWYEAEILKEYQDQDLSYRKVEATTKLNYNTVRVSVKSAVRKVIEMKVIQFKPYPNLDLWIKY